jgi:hypothetical protein
VSGVYVQLNNIFCVVCTAEKYTVYVVDYTVEQYIVYSVQLNNLLCKVYSTAESTQCIVYS